MSYTNVLSAVVSALAAECIDNTSKQAWQSKYEAGEARPVRAPVTAEDRLLNDCWVFARLHGQLLPRHWNVLVARYSTHSQRKSNAIMALVPLIASHASARFVERAVATWAIPKLKGEEGKRSTKDLIILPASWYDMNNWDENANTERTRQRWRKAIYDTLNEMVREALAAAEQILKEEGLLLDHAA